MTPTTISRDKEALRSASLPQSGPSAVLVLPFDPKMTKKQDIEVMLKRALGAAENRLLAAHESVSVIPVIRRLQQMVRNLNYSTFRKSVAMFASAEVGKILYLGFVVSETVLTDRPFCIRDLADCTPPAKEYLVLLLSSTQSMMYLANGNDLRLIKSNSPQNVYAHNFLHHMDVGLGAVLNLYHLPVFVVAPERVAGHFAAITHNERDIAGYVHHNGVDASVQQLQELLRPLLSDWHKLTQQLLRRQMEKAAEAGKLVCGLAEVRKAAGCSNARIIIVGRDDEQARSKEVFCTRDAFDEVVDKVLSNGGSVNKLDEDLMTPYDSIALIRYY